MLDITWKEVAAVIATLWLTAMSFIIAGFRDLFKGHLADDNRRFDALLERIDRNSREAKEDRKAMRDDIFAALTEQSRLNLELVRELGVLKGNNKEKS